MEIPRKFANFIKINTQIKPHSCHLSKFSGYAKEQFIYFLRSVYTPWPLSQEEDRQNERGYTSPARDVLCLGSFNDLEKLQEGKKKMKNKVLSVSIAAYNVAGTLREALDPFLESGVLDALDIMIHRICDKVPRYFSPDRQRKRRLGFHGEHRHRTCLRNFFPAAGW